MALQSVPPSARQPPKTTPPPSQGALFPQGTQEAGPPAGPRKPEGRVPRHTACLPARTPTQPGISSGQPLRRAGGSPSREHGGSRALLPAEAARQPGAGSTYIPIPPGHRSRLPGALPAGGAGPRPAEQRHHGHARGGRGRGRSPFCSARPEGGAEPDLLLLLLPLLFFFFPPPGRAPAELQGNAGVRSSRSARVFCEAAASAPALPQGCRGHPPTASFK